MPDTTIKIVAPKAWQSLLGIEDFAALPQRPEKWRKSESGPASIRQHLTDETPYRDDVRELEHVAGNRLIRVMLYSGSNNYWYSIEVYEKKSHEKDFAKAKAIYLSDDEVDFEIFTSLDLDLSDGSTLTLEIIADNRPVSAA